MYIKHTLCYDCFRIGASLERLVIGMFYMIAFQISSVFISSEYLLSKDYQVSLTSPYTVYPLMWSVKYKPIHTQSSQKRPYDFGNILLTKTFSWEFLKEKCWSAAKQQLPFKYFVNFHFIPKLLSKVWEKQTIPSRGTPSVNGLNVVASVDSFNMIPVIQNVTL